MYLWHADFRLRLFYGIFLYYSYPVKVVPILVGALNSDNEAMFGRLLAKYVDNPKNFFSVSSDFCHWGSRYCLQILCLLLVSMFWLYVLNLDLRKTRVGYPGSRENCLVWTRPVPRIYIAISSLMQVQKWPTWAGSDRVNWRKRPKVRLRSLGFSLWDLAQPSEWEARPYPTCKRKKKGLLRTHLPCSSRNSQFSYMSCLSRTRRQHN